MKIHGGAFRVREGEDVDLRKRPTKVDPFYDSKSDYAAILADHVERLSDLQQRLYAEDRTSLLLIFQALDAAGKDGTIRHVMSGVNPQGCHVVSFKQPSAEELQHDFLWRTTTHLPERGHIGIFNRSYYEEVLVARVHPKILRSEKLPDLDEDHIWRDRFRSIREHERHLHRNGTRIVKFYLHLSKDEQRRRFIDRIDEPDKNWKFNEGDLVERASWKQYRHAYEAALSATSTDDQPWFVVPADDKPNARLIVSQIVVEALEAIDPHFPEISDEHRRGLQAIRAQLAAEDGDRS